MNATTETGSASPARLGHRPGLDAVRGIAVVSIVVFHANPDWFPLAPVSLDAFFVLSTFLVTTVLLDAVARHGSPRPRRFFTRRARRLAAGLAAVLAAVLGLAAIGAYRNPDVGRTALGAALLHANVAQFSGDYFSAFADRNPLEHTWSLSVEEHFYLVTFAAVALAWVVGRRSIGRTRVLLGVFALATGVGAVLMSRHLLAAGATPNRIYMGSDTRAVAAAVGVGLAALTWGRWSLPRRTGRAVVLAAWMLVLAAGAAALAGWHPTLEWYASGGWALTAVASAVVVSAAARATTAGRISGNALLQWAGRRSYGIYLWHLPLLVLTAELGAWGVSAALAGTAAAAELSHRLVEQRFRADGLPDRTFVPAVVGAFAAIAVLALAVPTPELPGWATEPIAARTEAPPAMPPPAVPPPATPVPSAPAGAASGDHSTTGTGGGSARDDGSPGGPTAAETTPAPPTPLLVWGDAMADVVARQLTADARFAVTAQTEPGCTTAGACVGYQPAVPDGEFAAVVVAIGDPAPFHAPSSGALDLGEPEHQAAELWTRLVGAVGGRPVVLAMAPGARRDLGVGLHLRRMVGDDADNLVLDAEPARWPDALADRFAEGTGVPRRVLVVGDSVAYSLATAFRPEGTVVWDQSRHGCDPSPGDRVTVRNGRDRTPPACDWRTDWARAVGTWDPDVVLWHTGTWSTYDRFLDGERLEVGTAAWHDAVAAAHGAALDILGESGARVIVSVVAPAWETKPGKPVETRPEESAWRMPELLAAVHTAAAPHDDVTVLDTAEVLCAPDCDRPDLRGDGVHYTPEGARLVGDWLASRVRDIS